MFTIENGCLEFISEVFCFVCAVVVLLLASQLLLLSKKPTKSLERQTNRLYSAERESRVRRSTACEHDR
jgi:hypothetical protein